MHNIYSLHIFTVSPTWFGIKDTACIYCSTTPMINHCTNYCSFSKCQSCLLYLWHNYCSNHRW